MFLTENRKLLLELREQLGKLEVALVVSDPKISTSAEAYEGLRKQVGAAASERLAHLVQLAEMDRALQRGASEDDLRNLVAEWMAASSLQRSTDLLDDGRYDIVSGDPQKGQLQVRMPAYIDTSLRRVIRTGEAEYVSVAESNTARDASDATEPTPGPGDHVTEDVSRSDTDSEGAPR
jgi:phage-related baseplate assembly protein